MANSYNGMAKTSNTWDEGLNRKKQSLMQQGQNTREQSMGSLNDLRNANQNGKRPEQLGMAAIGSKQPAGVQLTASQKAGGGQQTASGFKSMLRQAQQSGDPRLQGAGAIQNEMNRYSTAMQQRQQPSGGLSVPGQGQVATAGPSQQAPPPSNWTHQPGGGGNNLLPPTSGGAPPSGGVMKPAPGNVPNYGTPTYANQQATPTPQVGQSNPLPTYEAGNLGWTSGINNPWPDAGSSPGVWEDDDAINSYYASAFNPYADRQLNRQIAQGTLDYNYANLNTQVGQQNVDNAFRNREFAELQGQNVHSNQMDRIGADQNQFGLNTNRFTAESAAGTNQYRADSERQQIQNQDEQFYAGMSQEQNQFVQTLGFKNKELSSQQAIAQEANSIQRLVAQGNISQQQGELALSTLQHEAQVQQATRDADWREKSGQQSLNIQQQGANTQQFTAEANAAYQQAQVGIQQDANRIDQMWKAGQLSAEERRTALAELKQRDDNALAIRAQGQVERYQGGQLGIGFGQLGVSQGDLALRQRAQQFEQRRRAYEFTQQQKLAREQSAMAAFGRWQAPRASFSRNWG